MDNPYSPTIYSLDTEFAQAMGEHIDVRHTMAAWEGALFIDCIGPAQGAIRMEHSAVQIMRWDSALVVQSLDHRTGWEVHEPQTRVWLPGEQFHYRWRTSPRCQQLLITKQQIETILDKPFHLCGLQPWAGIDFSDPVVNNLIESLGVDCSQAHVHGLLWGETRLVQLVSYLCQRRADAKTPSKRPDAQLPGVWLSAVLDYIHAHLDEALSLQTLSAQAHCTPQHFARLFRRSTGISAHQYVLNLRVERARELLSRDRQSLSQLAVEVGFADQSQFTKVFHKLCGTSPHRYRTMLRHSFGPAHN